MAGISVHLRTGKNVLLRTLMSASSEEKSGQEPGIRNEEQPSYHIQSVTQRPLIVTNSPDAGKLRKKTPLNPAETLARESWLTSELLDKLGLYTTEVYLRMREEVIQRQQLVVDGLGHGPDAAAVAATAVRIFRVNTRLGPADLLQTLHRALQSTRGAAAAVAEVDRAAGVISYAGVGNIAGVVLAGGARRSLMSHNGIVGHEARKFQAFSYPFPAGATLVMNSDGLGSRWDLDAYPGLITKDPGLVAGILYRDFQRGRDDMVAHEPEAL